MPSPTRTPRPSRTLRGLAAATAGLASAATVLVGVSGLPPAQADVTGPAADFLRPRDLPPDPTWIATEVEDGEPEIEEFCVGDVIQPDGTRYRAYYTDLDVWAQQHVTVAPTERKAKRLQHALNRALRSCADRYAAEHPDDVVADAAYGRIKVGDGARVRGVFIEHDYGALSANVLAVGRDGTKVTVFRYGRIGREADVPVKQVKHTARTAVVRLA